jgi:hypothetical protein
VHPPHPVRDSCGFREAIKSSFRHEFQGESKKSLIGTDMIY